MSPVAGQVVRAQRVVLTPVADLSVLQRVARSLTCGMFKIE